MDKYNQYKLTAWAAAFHSHAGSVPVVKQRQIVGWWAAEHFALLSKQTADSMLHDNIIRGGQASVFVFTARLDRTHIQVSEHEDGM